MSEVKTEIYALCVQFVRQRIETAEIALAQAREASNDDTKSSAGDKFETSREMAQQDIDRNKRLLMDAQENLAVLHNIQNLVDKSSDRIKPGSLIYTDQGIFYLSIGAGLLTVEDQKVFAMSAASPIGKMMIGKQENDTFTFNGKTYNILQVV